MNLRFDIPVAGMLRGAPAGCGELPGFDPRSPEMSLLFQPLLMLPKLPFLVNETPYLMALYPVGEALRIALVCLDDSLVARLLLAAPNPGPLSGDVIFVQPSGATTLRIRRGSLIRRGAGPRAERKNAASQCDEHGASKKACLEASFLFAMHEAFPFAPKYAPREVPT